MSICWYKFLTDLCGDLFFFFGLMFKEKSIKIRQVKTSSPAHKGESRFKFVFLMIEAIAFVQIRDCHIVQCWLCSFG